MAQRHENCDVCLEEYNELERIPKFLSCFHTFCASCLQNLQVNATITCPSCRKESAIAEGVDSLQSNFYILAKGENKEPTDDIKSNKKPIKNKIDEKIEWCTQCATLSRAECKRNVHDCRDLESEEGNEMAEIHLKLLLITCKDQWIVALNKRRDTDSKFEAVLKSLRVLEQQIIDTRKGSQEKMKRLQSSLADVAKIAPSGQQKRTSKEMKELFDKYTYRAAESKVYAKEATELSSAFDAIRDSVATLDVLKSEQQPLVVPLFHPAKLNFPSTGADEQESHLLTALSYLVLSGAFGDKLAPMKPAAAPTAAVQAPISNAAKQQTPKENKGARQKKSTESKSTPPTNIVAFNKSDPQHKTSKSAVEGNAFLNKPKFQPPQQQQVMDFTKAPPSPISTNPFLPRPPPPEVFAPFIGPSIDLKNKKCFMTIAVNGKTYGTIVIELRSDVAPIMCQRFAQSCLGNHGPSYHGSIIYKSLPKTVIMGGRLRESEGALYMADRSPLKKNRGAIFLRLKRDYSKTQCSIVSTEYCINLSDEKADYHRESTVFGYVCDGLAVCDAISHMDCEKADHVAIATAGLVG